MTTYDARKSKPFSLRFYKPVYKVHGSVETRSYTSKVATEESEERSKQCIDSYFAFVAEQITLLNKETAKS